MKEKELKEIYDIITESWKLAKKYCNIGKTDNEAWIKMGNDFSDIYMRHNQSVFCRDMAAAIMDAIGRVSDGKSL
jgi:hypothetical protein